MSPLLIKISKDFATLFTTINPIATLALFAGLTASLSRAERHWTALRACIYATIILVVAMTAGQVILDAIGIHMHSLKVADGIILFLFGAQMLFGKMDEKPGRSPEEGRDLAVFPLAVPSIAGGGALPINRNFHWEVVRPTDRRAASCSLAHFVRSATVAINMAEPSYFAPDEATVIISDYSLGRSETLKKFHSHVLPLSGEKA